ncbi:MAG: pantetheine-phosphate adenylyltransferase [Pyrinomonadaceae bacterium]
MMRRAIFPGSFDPLTNGHLDIIQRSAPLFDEIVIAVLNNPDKEPMFTVDERCRIIEEITRSLTSAACRLTAEGFSGLTADFARQKAAIAIIRGIRAVGDYEYELRMAMMNRRLQSKIETVFLTAAEEYSFVSSSLMKQVFELGGRVQGLVPEPVLAAMKQKLTRPPI